MSVRSACKVLNSYDEVDMVMDTQGYGSDSLKLYWKLMMDNSVQQLLSCKDRMDGYLPSPYF